MQQLKQGLLPRDEGSWLISDPTSFSCQLHSPRAKRGGLVPSRPDCTAYSKGVLACFCYCTDDDGGSRHAPRCPAGVQGKTTALARSAPQFRPFASVVCHTTEAWWAPWRRTLLFWGLGGTLGVEGRIIRGHQKGAQQRPSAPRMHRMRQNWEVQG